MSAEVKARRSAANIGDSLSRTALAVQLGDAAALLAGIEAGLRDATPDGRQVACTVAAQLGNALLSLRMLTDRIAAGSVFEPVEPPHTVDDLIDDTEPMYAVTSSHLAAVRAAGFRAGLEQRESVSA